MADEAPKAIANRNLDPKVFGLKVVAMHMEGLTPPAIAHRLTKETGISVGYRAVGRLLKSAECQRIMEELNESLMATAKHLARQRGARLVNDAMDVIEHHLKKKSLGAVPMVFQLVGLDVADKQPGDTKINIVFPGQEAPKDIVVEPTEVKDDDGDESPA